MRLGIGIWKKTKPTLEKQNVSGSDEMELKSQVTHNPVKVLHH